MNVLSPIFTEKRECQDCYKCVRNCPVKAIKIEGGAAAVITDLCVYCGTCVEVCPASAKRVRDDLARARQLVGSGRRVIVSLAPSYVSEFPGVRPGQWVRALRALGFADVSETALGAQQVSAHVRDTLRRRIDGTEPGPRVLLSSACPAVVAYLQRHRPHLAPYITGMLSPLLAHCTMLRRLYGPDVGIVFIGPCIAKKLEADAHPALLDVALTFEDLHRWLEQERIDPARLPEGPEDSFTPEAAREGAIYPVDGGMIAGIRAGCSVADCSFMAFSGLGAIQLALDGLEAIRPDGGLFIELLACEGGCVNGPRAHRKGHTAAKRYELLRQCDLSGTADRRAEFPIPMDVSAAPIIIPGPSDFQIREALRGVGKNTVADELNCGGCGYDSCRELGKALIAGKAERAMCVTYMRKLAHKKANALIQKMPSAVVIVDETLRVLEHNAAFAALVVRNGKGAAAASAATAAAAVPAVHAPAETDLEGRSLASLVPFHALFSTLLKSGEEMLDKDLRYRDTVHHVSVFTVERHRVVGGIIQDITRPAVQKEQVIRRAHEVIAKNLATVQRIAALLGENAAESEITLNSIIELFSPPPPEEGRPDDDGDWRKLYRR